MLHRMRRGRSRARSLDGRADAADAFGDCALPREAPARLVGVRPEEAQDLQVSGVETFIDDGAGRDDGIARAHRVSRRR